MRHPKHPCRDCGRPCSATAVRCKRCQLDAAKAARIARLVCSDCGGRVAFPGTARCMACYTADKRATAKLGGSLCPSCGGRKHVRARRCRACRWDDVRNGRESANDRSAVGFRPDVFRRVMERGGWTPALLEEWTIRNGEGVSRHTIARWLSGARLPGRHELAVVGRVLEMEPCRQCGGLGLVHGVERYDAMLLRLPMSRAARARRQRERVAEYRARKREEAS